MELDFDWMVAQKVGEGCGLGQEHWVTVEWAGDGRWRVEVVQRSVAEFHVSFRSSGYEVQMHLISPIEEKKKNERKIAI